MRFKQTVRTVAIYTAAVVVVVCLEYDCQTEGILLQRGFNSELSEYNCPLQPSDSSHVFISLFFKCSSNVV